MDDGYDSRFSYLSGTSTVPSSNHRGRRVAGIAAGTAALAAALRGRRHRSRSDSRMYDDSRVSEVTDEKYSDETGPRHSHWRKRLLEVAGVVGVLALAKKFFDSRRRREEDSEVGTYQTTTNSETANMTEDSYSRTDYGPPPGRPLHRRRSSSLSSRSRSGSRSRSRSPSGSRSPASSYYNSSYMDDRNDTGQSHPLRNALAAGGVVAAAKALFSSRKRNEQRRVDDVFRRGDEDERIQRQNSRRYSGAGTPGPRKLKKPMYNMGDDVSSSESFMPHRPLASGGIRPNGRPMQTPMPGSSGPSGPPMPVPPGAMAASGYGESPPLSARLKTRNDGTNVTLRRLTDGEAAASRERKYNRHRRGSASSLSGNEAGADRWRRVEEMERRQDEQIRRERAAATRRPSQVPPPPPIPSQASYNYGPGSYTSPTFTGTEGSGDYAGNRRRRRAERARARQERHQNSVEFT